jgi:tetratricopeptide (TPR) repeat protein
MPATRIVITMLSLLVLASDASAQSVDLVVFGPIGDGKTTKLVAEAMTKGRVGTTSPKQLDVACATSIACLVTSGAEASARRVLAVSVVGGKIGFVLVDVGDKELISKRDVTISDRRIAKELGPQLKKFLDAAPTDRAKTLFAIGNRHYELAEYPQALETYKKAYRVRPLPAFQFNIAQCHRKLGAHKEAIQMYQAYLVGVPNADNKALVESLIAESQNQISSAEKAVRDSEQAKLDTEKKTAEEARLAAEAAQKTKEAVANAESERRKQMQATLEAERERELDKTYNKHPARRWMIATGVAGLAVAGAGAYFGLSARKHQSAFDDAGCGDPSQSLPEATLDACRDDKDTGAQHARLANILVGTGGGIVLASLLVYIIDPGNIERPKERATVTVSPSSVNVVVRW